MLTGIHGRAGTVLWGGYVVDTIGVSCKNILTGAPYTSGTVGNAAPAATPFTLDCPAGQRVIGIQGRQGGLLDQISIRGPFRGGAHSPFLGRRAQ